MKFTYLCTIKNVQIKSHNEETNLTEYVIIQRNVDIAGVLIFFSKKKKSNSMFYACSLSHIHTFKVTQNG